MESWVPWSCHLRRGGFRRRPEPNLQLRRGRATAPVLFILFPRLTTDDLLRCELPFTVPDIYKHIYRRKNSGCPSLLQKPEFAEFCKSIRCNGATMLGGAAICGQDARSAHGVESADVERGGRNPCRGINAPSPSRTRARLTGHNWPIHARKTENWPTTGQTVSPVFNHLEAQPLPNQRFCYLDTVEVSGASKRHPERGSAGKACSAQARARRLQRISVTGAGPSLPQ